MISTKFINPILTEMSYHDGTLTVRLRGVNRTYYGVGREVAYKVYYNGLSAYSSLVKGKFKTKQNDNKHN